MKKIKLILSDLDGTLLPPSCEISGAAVRMIEKIRDRDLIFGICTGRPYPSVLPVMQNAGLSLPLITANGAVTYIGEESLSVHSFRLKPFQALVGLALSQYLTVLILQNGQERQLTHPLDIAWEDATAEKLTILSGQLQVRFHLLYPELCSLDKDYSISSYSDRGCEITAREANKASAMLRLCEYFGIYPNNVMAIGDNENDREMIRLAGLGIAVANASDMVRSAADYVCRQPYTEGVIEAVDSFVLSC